MKTYFKQVPALQARHSVAGWGMAPLKVGQAELKAIQARLSEKAISPALDEFMSKPSILEQGPLVLRRNG